MKALFICALSLLLCQLHAGALRPQYSVIHYEQTNGFPGNYGYSIFQDHLGYIWISSENGLTRFNGYEFRLFTTKEGLPNNEVFSMNEDSARRVWFAPFAKTVGYIRNGLVHNASNDATLRRMRFKVRPSNLLPDKYGNMLIWEDENMYRVDRSDKISRIDLPAGISTYVVFKDGHDDIQVLCDQPAFLALYRFDGQTLSRVAVINDTGVSFGTLAHYLLPVLGREVAVSFVRKAIASGQPFYCSEAELLMTLQIHYDIKQEKKRRTEDIHPDFSKLRRILFWDTSMEKIDWMRQKRSVIRRVFERGNAREKVAIRQFYGKDVVDKVLAETSRIALKG